MTPIVAGLGILLAAIAPEADEFWHPRYLTPPPSYFATEGNELANYERMLRRLFDPGDVNGDLDYPLRVRFSPSLVPEKEACVRFLRSGEAVVELRVAEKCAWCSRSESNDFVDVPVRLERAPIPWEIALRLREAWRRQISLARFPDPEKIAGTVGGCVDGASFVFLRADAWGMAYCNPWFSPADRMQDLGWAVIAYVTATPDERRFLERRMTALATALGSDAPLRRPVLASCRAMNPELPMAPDGGRVAAISLVPFFPLGVRLDFRVELPASGDAKVTLPGPDGNVATRPLDRATAIHLLDVLDLAVDERIGWLAEGRPAGSTIATPAGCAERMNPDRSYDDLVLKLADHVLAPEDREKRRALDEAIERLSGF